MGRHANAILSSQRVALAGNLFFLFINLKAIQPSNHSTVMSLAIALCLSTCVCSANTDSTAPDSEATLGALSVLNDYHERDELAYTQS